MPKSSARSVPTASALYASAVAHLARYAATRAGLARVLDRRIDRWARAALAEAGADPERIASKAAEARRAVGPVVQRLAEAGAVNDAAFAEMRARRLVRAGRSRRVVAAHLAARGVDGETVEAALPPDAGAELAAAVAFTRRRRIGPFRAAGIVEAADTEDGPGFARELAMLARAGFDRGVAQQALTMPAEQAEAILFALRQGRGG